MLNPKERAAYEAMLSRTRRDYLALERKVAEELATAKTRISGIRSQMESLLKIYEGICERLGIENDMVAEEDGDAGDGSEE